MASGAPSAYPAKMNPRAILSPQQMCDAEADVVAAGTSGYALMQRAGAAVANVLHRQCPDGRVRILCGPGGNGGDGFVAASCLVELGRDVDVFSLSPVADLTGDAAQAATDWAGDVQPLDAAVGSGHPITLDALFGAGLSREMTGAAAILALEPGRVVSVDVPSGISGLTGHALGSHFTADQTVTFAALRPAHVLEDRKSVV